MAGRIYLVTDRAGRGQSLWVRAHNLNAAIRAVAHMTWTAKAATTDEVYVAMREGVSVIDSTAEDPPLEPQVDDGELKFGAAAHL